MPPNDLDSCWYLTGPTAGGKTAVGLELARLVGAEIVSLDSMALYRGLDIGTAKPTPDQRRRVPHHLIDLVEPEDEFSVAQYCEAAAATVAEITARGRQPLFVGGTPLYLKSLLRGIFEGPPADWAWRTQIEEQAAANGPDWLHARLAEVDPRAAARLHPHDTRRLIRALEVYAKTGRPISDWQQQFDRGRPAEECRVFVLDWPREQLYERINRRVETMFSDGLVLEVQELLQSGRRFGRTARQAVGYREVLEHLEGQRDLAATIELVQQRTRQFARRQLTWFRSLSECRRVPMTAGEHAVETAEIARRIAEQAGGEQPAAGSIG
ncbi:MAG TPA: tRNA (adenosine(37)-N6)-dimethylallyltransferase MiaA [Pirellulales bacterium]|nr:tRNA (adenosine(37)-N6)-dimethylallyltransferase MiaA [Pirellulales bacterium]